ncbi:MAG: hypothetical protein U0T82_05735 [Bacteroidales bacterium]
MTIAVNDLNGPVQGSTTKVYQLTTSNPGGVLNVQPSGEYLAGTDIIDPAHQPTNQVQSVTYHFKARIRDDRAGHSGQFCDQGGDTTITLHVNPTPRLFASVAPDTILCDSSTLTITVDDLNGPVHGNYHQNTSSQPPTDRCSTFSPPVSTWQVPTSSISSSTPPTRYRARYLSLQGPLYAMTVQDTVVSSAIKVVIQRL